MYTRTSGTRVDRARYWCRRAALRVFLVTASTIVLTACGPSPDEPAAGELSGVVVSRNDQPMLFGGGTVDSFSRILVLTSDELLAAFETSWPRRDVPAGHDIASVVIKVNVEDLPPDGLAEVSDGRFRVPWPEAGRYLCLANEYRGAVTTAGCVLVDAEAPVKVTIESSIGGFSLKT